MSAGLAFSLEEYRDRLQRVQSRMTERGIDLLLITTPENNFYLSGYETTGYYMYQAALVPAEGDPVPIVRSLEQTLLETGTWIGSGEVYLDTDDTAGFTAKVIAERFGDRLTIGLEEQIFFLPVSFHRKLASALPDSTLVDGSGIVESERLIKSEQELAYIRQAARAATMGLLRGLGAIEPGVSENILAAAVYEGLLSAGSEYPGDQPYVASGPRSGLAHATWAGRRVESGDAVFLEVGGCVRRYAGAHMRTAFVGEPDNEVRRRAEVVAEALTAAIEAIKPGATSGEVDAACRGVIERAGYGHLFRHRTGYSVGLAFPPGWGEGHIMDLKPHDESVLQANTVFHLVPILHEPGLHGIGMSETVLVTETGCEVLTDYPRELAIISDVPGSVATVGEKAYATTSRGRTRMSESPLGEIEHIPLGGVQQSLADAFRGKSIWRRRKAEEFPDDLRNFHAARGLESLAEWVLNVPDDDWRIREIAEMYGPDAIDLIGEFQYSSQAIARFNFGQDPEPPIEKEFNRFLEELLDVLEQDVIEFREFEESGGL